MPPFQPAVLPASSAKVKKGWIAVEFYDVRTRAKVIVPDDRVRKQKIERVTASGVQTRYAVTAEEGGSRLFKFVSRDLYERLNVPEVS